MGRGREIRFVAIVTGVSQTQQSKTNDFLVTLLSSSSLPHSQPEFHPAYQIRVSHFQLRTQSPLNFRSGFTAILVRSESNRGVNCARLEVSPIAIADDKNPLFAVAAVIVRESGLLNDAAANDCSSGVSGAAANWAACCVTLLSPERRRRGRIATHAKSPERWRWRAATIPCSQSRLQVSYSQPQPPT